MGVRTDTRDRMITSAALLLGERGVSGTSVAKVLERSNGPRGSVGFHFPGGRAEILTEALAWAGRQVTETLELARQDGGTPAEVFALICDHYAKQLTRTQFLAGCPVGAAAQEAFADADLGPIVATIFETWTQTLTESLLSAKHPAGDARDLALLSICALEGAIMVARVQKDTRAIDIVKARMLPLLNGPHA